MRSTSNGSLRYLALALGLSACAAPCEDRAEPGATDFCFSRPDSDPAIESGTLSYARDEVVFRYTTVDGIEYEAVFEVQGVHHSSSYDE